MPTRETNDGRDNGGLRAEFPAGESLIPTEVGSSGPMYPPLPASFSEDTHSQLDVVGEAIANTEIAFLSTAIDRITQIEQPIADIQNVLLGEIGVKLDKVWRAIDAIRKKVSANTVRTVSDMYQYLGAIGIGHVPLESVYYGLQSGDYLGSVGIEGAEKGSPSVIPIEQFGGPGDITPPHPVPINTDPPIAPPEWLPTVPPATQPPVPPTTIPEPPPFGSPPTNCDRWIPRVFYANCAAEEADLARTHEMVGIYHDCFFLCEGVTYNEWKPVCKLYTNKPYGPGWEEVKSFWLRMGYYPMLDSPTTWLSTITGRREQTSGNTELFFEFAGQRIGPCSSGDGTIPPGEVVPPDQQPVCYTPPADDCKLPPPKPIDVPISPDANTCEELKTVIDYYANLTPHISDWIKASAGGEKPSGIAATIAQALTGVPQAVIPNLINSFAKWFEGIVKTSVQSTNCDSGSLMPVAITQAIVNLIQLYTGAVPKQFTNTLNQVSNTICQSNIPDGGMADLAYLRGDINRELWECFHKAAGDPIGEYHKIMMAGRAKADPSQIDKLYRRKFIPAETYSQWMREAGVMKDEDRENIHNLNQAFPTLSDVQVMMNRDVANEKDVDWTKADELFKANYQGQIKDWYEANGVDEQLAKYQWRAHFHIPSYTMGQQMLFRLREDVVGPEHKFDREDMRKMLIQDDWHPAFIDRMIDTAYHAVTKTDAVRAFMVFSIDETELYSRFLDFGYTAESAEFYVKYHKQNRTIHMRRQSGYPTMRALTSSFARCEITNSQYRDTVAKIVISEEQEQNAIEASKIARDVYIRKQNIRAIRRPYVLGIIDDQEAFERMDAAGIDGECRDELLGIWQLDRLRRDKTLTASTLCDMISKGIIDANTYISALIRSGYSLHDANAMLLLCNAKLTEKQQKAAEALARRLAIEAEKQRKAMEKARKLAECGPPDCPKSTPGGKQNPPVVAY